MKKPLILLSALALVSATAEEDKNPGYRNPQLPVEQRIADLLERMTLDEKVAQLRTEWELPNLSDAAGKFDPAKAGKLLAAGIGGFGPLRLPIAGEVEFRNSAQQFIREHTRLGIPLIFHEEACHGVLAPNANSFPAPIGLASSWDEDLAERVFTAVAAEMSSRGIQQALTPILDICRDPRWGRTDEMLGEDSHLNGKLGIAMVRGLQGRQTGTIPAGRVAVTLKHLTGHGQPEAGVNRAPAHMGPREVLESHLVPFAMVLAETQPAAVMPSYNEIDGIPSHANRWLLQDILRKQLGFSGLVTSDYFGVSDLCDFHHIAANRPEAAFQAFTAGVDMDLPGGGSFSALGTWVKNGRIPESALDASVARVLRLKFQLGLFENAPSDAAQAEALVKLESTRALALESARKSVILLKNHNGLLPLAKGAHKTIAVIGPHADDTRLGSYSGEPPYTVSILEGIRRATEGTAKVLHAKGCSLTLNEGKSSMLAWNKVDRQQFPDPEKDRTMIAEATKVAAAADLIVLVLGENELICRESWSQDHFGDRASLDLFGRQNELAAAIFHLGKPVIVHLMNGRPLAIPHIVEQADALLEGWYLGQETGNAVADILFGNANPSGKLTVTIPREVGQIPIYYNHKPSSRGFPYLDAERTPLFPFGFGLSYTTFAYGEPTLQSAEIPVDGSTALGITVSNTGKTAGDEIAQLYIRDKTASVTRPVRELKGFQRIHLSPGQTKTLTFPITPDMLALWNQDLKHTVEPGEFEITVGPSSVEGKTTVLHVLPRSK